MCRAWIIRFYSILFHLACLSHDFPDQPTRICPRKSSLHFGSRACSKIEQWILEEFYFARLLLFMRWHLNCLPSSFNRKIRYFKFKINKMKIKAHTREGGPNTFSFRGGGTSLITSHWARGAPNPPTHNSITVFSWLALIDPYCIGIRRPSFYCCKLISSMFDSTLC